MTSSNPNSPTNSPLTFQPFARGNGRRFRFMPANDDGNQVPPSVAPATPVGFDLFNFMNLGTSVVLNWSDGGSGSNRATSYTYEWKTSAASTYSTGTTSNTSVEITGLPEDTLHDFRVRAVNDIGQSGYASLTSVRTKLAPPTNVSISRSGTTINLSWTDNSSVETTYLVSRSIDGQPASVLIGQLSAGTTSFSDPERSPGYYDYFVTAVKNYEQPTQNDSPVVSVSLEYANANGTPLAPRNLLLPGVGPAESDFTSYGVVGPDYVDLSWNPPIGSAPVTSYEVNLGNTNIFDYENPIWTTTSITGLTATSTRFQLSDPLPPQGAGPEGQERFFRVRAVNANGSGQWSLWNVAVTSLYSPTNISASVSGTNVVVSWVNNSWAASYYRIYRSVNGGSFSLLNDYQFENNGAGTTVTYTDSTTTEGNSYRYRVLAANTTYSSFSLYLTQATAVSVPASATPTPPTNLFASVFSTSAIDLTWTDASGNETGFLIERQDFNMVVGGYGSWSQVASVGANTTSYRNSGLSEGTIYKFRVRATNAIGNSAYSNEMFEATKCAAPSNFTVTSSTQTSISLSWTNNSLTNTRFILQRRVSGTPNWFGTTNLSGSATSHTVTGLTSGTSYDFQIQAALQTNGGSDFVSTTGSTVAAANAVPSVPTGLSASAASTTQINLTWNIDSTAAPNQADYYEIDVSTDNVLFSPLTTINNPGTGSFSATNLTPATQYWFRMSSCNTVGCSARTASATATTQSGAVSPSWTLDFSSGTPSGYTLTRASSGTYVDSSGYIASASTNLARLTHDKNGARLGLLVEESRTNILARSQDFNTGWAGGNTNVTTDAIAAPDNATTADKIAANTTNASHWRRLGAITPVAGTTYVFSCFFKTGGGNATHAILSIETTGTDRSYTAKYDTSTGARTDTDSSGTPVNTDSPTQAEDMGNGWWRAWVRIEHSTGNTGLRAYVGLSNAATGIALPSWTGAAGDADFIYFWGTQVEASTNVPTAYIPTTTTSVTRSADLVHVLDSSITNWGDPGALVVHFYPPSQAGTLLSTDDASTAQVGIEASTTTAARAFWSSGSTSTGTIGSGVQKAVHYWNGSSSKFCINGGTVQSGTNNLTIANTDFVTLGAEATESGGVPGTFSQYANCIIRKVEFYSGTLTDSQLQAITT